MTYCKYKSSVYVPGYIRDYLKTNAFPVKQCRARRLSTRRDESSFATTGVSIPRAVAQSS